MNKACFHDFVDPGLQGAGGADCYIYQAEDTPMLNPAGKAVEREGLVIRPADRTISFKAISNRFLLEETN